MAAINGKILIAVVPLPIGLVLLPLIYTAGNDPGHQAAAVAGWMLLLLVVQSVAALVAGSVCQTIRSCCTAAIISGGTAAIAATLGCGAGLIPTSVLLPSGAVFLAWAMFCSGLAKALNRWGIAAAVPVGILLAGLLIFSPVALTPLFVILQRSDLRWHTVASVAVNMSPAIWMIDALATGLHYNWFIWFHAPVMYQHVVLGQNTLMPRLWPWWLPCAGAGVIGIMAAAWPRSVPKISAH